MTLNLDGSTADVEKLAANIGTIAWSTLLDALAGYSSGLDDLAPDDWRQELLRHTDAVSAAVQAAALPSFRKIARSADQQVKTTPLNQQKLVEPWLQKMSQAGAFTDPKSLEESKKVNKIVLAARTKTQEYVGYAMSGLKGQAAETFTQITSDAALAIKNGKTPQEGLAQASRAWAKTGVPTLLDKSGRHWQPETYLRMVVQNQVKQTTNDVMIQRTKETSGLVKVSSHAACRPTHLPYQGQVYSVNGDITDYPDLYEATNFGSAGGLSGINCHHYVMTYVPGFDTPDYDTADPDSNNAAYALTQRQRKLERDVRAAKREQMAAKEFGNDTDVAAANRLIRARQGSLKEFVDRHSDTLRRDYARENTKNLEVYYRAAVKADKALETAKAVEPSITSSLQEITQEVGDHLTGLDYKIKGKDSLVRKMSQEPDAKMRDVVRYTSISDPENLADHYRKVVAEFEYRGYTQTAEKNYWNTPNSENAYNGLNCNFKTPDGYEFELQFHTEESFKLKDGALHKLYEEQRLLDPVKDSARVKELNQQMLHLSNGLTRPVGIDRIGRS